MPYPQYMPGYAGALANMYDLDINPEDTSILEANRVAPGQVGALMQHLANTALQRRQMALEELMRPYRDIINPDLNRRAKIAMAAAGLGGKERLAEQNLGMSQMRETGRNTRAGLRESGAMNRAALAAQAQRGLTEYVQNQKNIRSQRALEAKEQAQTRKQQNALRSKQAALLSKPTGRTTFMPGDTVEERARKRAQLDQLYGSEYWQRALQKAGGDKVTAMNLLQQFYLIQMGVQNAG